MRKTKRKTRKKKVKKVNRKRLTVFIVIVVIVALGIIFREQIISLTTQKQEKFIWNNITWYKTDYENLTLYKTMLSINRTGEDQLFYYPLYLRNDPKQLEKIPVTINTKLEDMVYVSFDAEPLKCEKVIIAAWELGAFIDALDKEKEGAFAKEELVNNTAYENMSNKVKNCEDAEKGTSVVLFTDSEINKSHIHQEGYCYVLEIANCEVIEISERFILALIDIMRQ